MNYDAVMQRWHVPFDHIENNWTELQFLCLLGAVKESERRGDRKTAKAPDGTDRIVISGRAFQDSLGKK